MTDGTGHQLPNAVYPANLDSAEPMEWVERCYAKYYLRPEWLGALCAKRYSMGRSDGDHTKKRENTWRALRQQRRQFIKEQRAVD
jgi:hypothetical protein